MAPTALSDHLNTCTPPSIRQLIDYYADMRFRGDFPSDPEVVAQHWRTVHHYRGPAKEDKANAMTRLELHLADIGVQYKPEEQAEISRIEARIATLSKQLDREKEKLVGASRRTERDNNAKD